MEWHYLVKCLVVVIWAASLNVLLANELPNKPCGYKSCIPLKKDFINVHVIPHSHLDLGWINTLDDYFHGYGRKSCNVCGLIIPNGVKNLISDVIVALKAKPYRRFVFAETAFLWMWWQESNTTFKHLIQELVNNGQLEIVGGGWSMNDEAVTHYQSIIDQYTLGFRKLDEMFGECGIPKVGWQIDPFGHSREMASLFAEMDFDGLFLGRVDTHERAFRFETQTAEFIWKGSGSLGARSHILTTILPNIYEPPENICLSCHETLSSTAESFEQTLDSTLHQLENQAKAYATKNLIVTMGGDFQYQYPVESFSSVELIMRYLNENQGEMHKFNLFYSTPSCYLKAVRDEAKKKNMKFLLKTDDFFPYSTKHDMHWTGFYTSRPSLKRLERLGNNYLQICKNLFVLANLPPSFLANIESMSSEMGILQHHDAITGTERQMVSDDYVARLSEAFGACNEVIYEALNKIVMQGSNATRKLEFENCILRNISQCRRTEYLARFVVTVYNPLGRPINYSVRFPVQWKNSQVIDHKGTVIASDVIPIMDAIMKHPVRQSKTTNEVVFNAANVPAFGFRMYYVQKLPGDAVLRLKDAQDLKFNNIEISINQTSGKLAKVIMNGKLLNLTQDFFYYNGYDMTHSIDGAQSGAYVFKPYRQHIIVNEKAITKVYVGKVIAEVHQYFNNWTSQIIRINKNENFIEFDWIIGPLPTSHHGKEVITKFSTPLQTNATFYTDSSGRQTMKRVRNYRRAFIFASRGRAAANYYPVTTKIVLRDENDDVEFAVLTDRPQGGTSMEDGTVDLMIHRACLYDDGLGLGESLVETENGENLIVRGSHYLVFGSIKDKSVDNIKAQVHDIIQRKHLSAWALVSSTNGLDYNKFKQNYKMEFSGLASELPKTLHILTLEPWKNSKLLLRIEHIYEADEHSDLSKPVAINIENLFSGFRVVSAIETTLGANKWMSEKNVDRNTVEIGDTMEKLVKTTTTDTRYWRLKFPDSNYTCNRQNVLKGFIVTLCPLEIRTFVIDVKRSVF